MLLRRGERERRKALMVSNFGVFTGRFPTGDVSSMIVKGFPVNMPDPFRKRFGYGQRAARMARILYARSDVMHPFQFRFFQRRHRPYCAKPTGIRSGRPGQGLAKRI